MHLTAPPGLCEQRDAARKAVVDTLEAIERTGRSSGYLLDVGVDHRGLQTSMPQQELNRPDVGPIVQEMGRERVAQRMDARVLDDACSL